MEVCQYLYPYNHQPQKIMKRYTWKPDLPDHRDLTLEHLQAKKPFKITKAAPAVNLQKWCSPVQDQGDTPFLISL